MDKVERYREIIHRVIEEMAAMLSEGNRIAILPVCDPTHDEYLLISLGWHHEGREHDIVFHAQLRNGKVAVLDDRTEEGIATFLTEAGVDDADIELAWAGRKREENQATIAA